jgi:hypothetical protein
MVLCMEGHAAGPGEPTQRKNPPRTGVVGMAGSICFALSTTSGAGTARKGKYIVATINLKGLPKGAFTVKIHATTVLGHTLSTSRTYHTCIKKIKKSSKKK